MKVSALDEYGLRCLLQLATSYQTNLPLKITEIAEAEGLSTPYVGKIMTMLKLSGLITSIRGCSGGYLLSRNPNKIKLDDALAALGGRIFSSNFCEQHHGVNDACVHINECTIRPVWYAVDIMVASILKRISLADLLKTEKSVQEILSKSTTEEFQDLLKNQALKIAVST